MDVQGEANKQNTLRASNWNDLNEMLYEGAWQEPLSRFRSTCAFRGMTGVGHDLSTSLARMGDSARELEQPMLRAFRKYARQQVAPETSIWIWLALAQHHGLATRLLDWTYSPLVAMHFATEHVEHFDLDGVIWSINYTRTNQLLPVGLQAILRGEGSDVFDVESLAAAAQTLDDFDRLSATPFVAFFEPPSLDERIVNQYALFSLVSDPSLPLDYWLCEHPDVYRRIIIPAGLKQEVRDKLDQANITERVLYPGLDGLCRWLKRYYTPAVSGCVQSARERET